MTIFFVFITAVYFVIMLGLLLGWQKIPRFLLMHSSQKICFSIVISYRNEADSLPDLLNSISKLKYPSSKFELLMVNDSSEDDSRNICSDFKSRYPTLQISLIENRRISGSPKKDAILTAVKRASFPYILTTDADCRVPEFWLQALNEKILQGGDKLIAGPVATSYFPAEVIRKEKKSQVFHAFQELDFLSLQIAGAGGFGLNQAFMCNGANLCYSKSAFLALDGFKGNDTISSGDDVFLLQKFAEKKMKITFLKCEDAIVHTQPQTDLTSLVSQRIRWASKAPAYKSLVAQLTGISVLLMNFSLILGSLLTVFNFIPYQSVLFAFFVKFTIDFALLFYSADFFHRKKLLQNYFWSSLVYPFFSSTIALLSLFKKFEWKGRIYKK